MTGVLGNVLIRYGWYWNNGFWSDYGLVWSQLRIFTKRSRQEQLSERGGGLVWSVRPGLVRHDFILELFARLALHGMERGSEVVRCDEVIKGTYVYAAARYMNLLAEWLDGCMDLFCLRYLDSMAWLTYKLVL